MAAKEKDRSQKTGAPPAAKKNAKGELVTEQSNLKSYMETLKYNKMLEHRKMKTELSAMFNFKMELFSLRFEV